MILLAILCLLIGNVCSRDFWYGDHLEGPFYNNISLHKNQPIILPVQENLTIHNLNGILYSNSLSQLNVTNLHLYFATIENVESGALCSSPTLRRLQFDMGEELRITKDMLKNCEKLEELYLRGTYTLNAIDNDVFDNLPNLKHLVLYYFKFENLPRSFFEKISTLQYLRIDSCSLKEIDVDAFVDLVNLKEFELLQIPELNHSPEIIFKTKIRAEKLVVRGVNGSLSSNLLSQFNVSELRLNFRYLSGIEPGAICSSPALKRFEISIRRDNGVTITKEIFQNCQKLEKLTITGNYENQVEETAFENVQNLRSLSLGAVSINHLTRNYFKTLSLLEVLYLHSTEIQKVDEEAFNDLKQLKTLGISNNENLGHIPKKLFAENLHLESLSLAGNNITNLTWDEFKDLSFLKNLNVNYNPILNYNVQKIAQNMPNLKRFEFVGERTYCKEQQITFMKELSSKFNHTIDVSCVDKLKGYLVDFGF